MVCIGVGSVAGVGGSATVPAASLVVLVVMVAAMVVTVVADVGHRIDDVAN
jgi:hypothetical protein